MEYETRTISTIVMPKDSTIGDENATTISIDNEGAGEFVTLNQMGHIVKIEPCEWPVLRDAISSMIFLCRPV